MEYNNNDNSLKQVIESDHDGFEIPTKKLKISNNHTTDVAPTITTTAKISKVKFKSGGFPPQLFIETPRVDFICKQCSEVYKNPYQCPAGHTFCESCIQNDLVKVCPQCYIPIPSHQLKKNLLVGNAIDHLKIRCWKNMPTNPKSSIIGSATIHVTFAVPEDSVGCNWEGKLNELEHHLRNECLLTAASCHHPNCKFKSVRHELISKHLPTCGHQVVSCKMEGCFETFPLDDRDFHLSVCKFNFKACPNACGVKTITTDKEMTFHVGSTCPLASITCPLFQLTLGAGASTLIDSTGTPKTTAASEGLCTCTNEGMILRKDMQSHLSDPKLLQSTLSTCLTELVNLKAHVATLQSENKSLSSRLDIFESKQLLKQK